MIKLSEISNFLQPSAMQRSLNIDNREKYISFALGLPANETLPVDLLKQTVLFHNNPSSMQYSPPLLTLKQQIKELVKQRGIDCEIDEIFITAGAQQGISLLTRLIAGNNSTVVTEELVYPGFVQVAQSVNANILTISSDYQQGINLQELEQAILNSSVKPALIYIVADGNNPLSVSLPIESRKKLAEIARKYQIPILEDDPYGYLHYDNAGLPAIKSFDSDYVCYVGSFSKIIAPALRVGWVIVPKHLIEKLSILKESSDVDTAPFSQRIVSSFIENRHLSSHLNYINGLYKQKRNWMNECLKKYLVQHVKWHLPTSGIFFWLEFDKDFDAKKLFQLALKQCVIIIPGSDFAVDGKCVAQNCIRLNFSFPSKKEIEQGIKLLADVIGEM